MKWLRRIFNFYLNSSIHVSLGVVALVIVTYRTLNISCDKNLLFFIFFASITGYNFIKYSSLAKLHHRSLTESLRVIQIFSLISFVAMGYFIFKLSQSVLLACVIFGGCTLLYALPIFSRKRNLRSFYGAKMYTIAFVWAGVTVLLPVLQNELPISVDAWISFVQRFLFVTIITLPFDIRDLRYDVKEDINTIPKRLGVKGAKRLGIVLVFLFFILEYGKDQLVTIHLLSAVLISILSIILLLVSSDKQSKYYASFFVEGLPMMWVGLLSLFEMLLP